MPFAEDHLSMLEPDVVVVLAYNILKLVRDLVVPHMIIYHIHLIREHIMPLVQIFDQRRHGAENRSRKRLTHHHREDDEHKLRVLICFDAFSH